MGIARLEANGDAPGGPVEHKVLAPNRPVTDERPVVEAEALRELVGSTFVERGAVRCGETLRAAIAKIGFRCPQVVPVGPGLDTGPLDGDEFALNAEEPLDD